MATFTSKVVTGNWSTAGQSTWNETGIPADGDSITITEGSVITFDNSTLWSDGTGTGIALTVNGTLQFSETAGSYYLKLKANCSSVSGGSGAKLIKICHVADGTAYPSNCNAVIYPNGYEFTGTNGLRLQVACTDPTNKFAKVIGSGGLAISSISKANPAIVTTGSAHGLSAGATINLVSITGMTELNGLRCKVAASPAPTTYTFALQWYDVTTATSVDSTNFGTFTAGYVCPTAVSSSNTLYIDRDLSSDTPWASGAFAMVSNVARTNGISPAQGYFYSISSVTSSTVVLTGNIYTSAGALSSSSNTCPALEAGAVLALVGRNIRIMGTVGGNGLCNAMTNGSLAAEIHVGTSATVFNGCTSSTISGGSVCGNQNVFNNSTGGTLSNGSVCGNQYVVNGCTSSTISGGSVCGNQYVFNSGTGGTLSNGSVCGNQNVFNNSTGGTLSNGSVCGNQYVVTGGTSSTISGGSVCGNQYVFNNSTGGTLSNGSVCGNQYVFNNSTGGTISGGSVCGNQYASYNSTGGTLSGGSVCGNQYVFYGSNLTNSYNHYILGGTFSNNVVFAYQSLNLTVTSVSITGTPSGQKTFDTCSPISLSNVTLDSAGLATALSACYFVTASYCTFYNLVDFSSNCSAILGNCISNSTSLGSMTNTSAGSAFVISYEHNVRAASPAPAGAVKALMPSGTVIYTSSDPNTPNLGLVHTMAFGNSGGVMPVPMSMSYPMWLTPQTLTITINYKRDVVLGTTPITFQLVNGDTAIGCAEVPITPASSTGWSGTAGVDANSSGDNNNWQTNKTLTYTISAAGLYTFRVFGTVAVSATANLLYSWQPSASSIAGQPAQGDVRYGTVYGPSNNLTGTCYVPGASSVAAGVNVDNTTGTALLTAAGLLDLTDGIETGITPRKAARAMAAMLAGIASGGGSGTEVFKGIGQASGGTTRVTMTDDASGNRSAVTLNL